MLRFKIVKCRHGYKVKCEGTDIAHAVWPTRKQAAIYVRHILFVGDTIEVCKD